MTEIEKGIPIPPDPRGRPRTSKFRDMKVGDSYPSGNRSFGVQAAKWGRTQKPLRIFRTLRQTDVPYRTWRIK
jgi:hypothetical protein